MKSFFKKLINKIKSFFEGLKNSDPKPTKIHKFSKEKVNEYYEQANGWAYDIFDSVVVSRDRWKLFGIISIVIIFLEIFIILSMFPLQKVIPIVIHKDDNGVVWVDAPNGNISGQKITIKNKAEIREDLYRFVQEFESYDPYTTLKIGRKYVENMAVPKVYQQFEQQLSNPDSYFTKLGAKGSRKIIVESVSILALAKADDPNNTAIVRFESEERTNRGVVSDRRQWLATVVFRFNGIPTDPVQQFINYNGFEVQSYKVVPFDQGN